MNTAVEASSLTKKYGKLLALDDCSFTIPSGRIVALVGPNGAGKTTLLHLAVGLLRPTGGSIRILESTPAANEEVLSRVGFVAQDVPLYKSFTVSDLITWGEHMNARWDSELCRSRFSHLGIPLDRRAGELSGGQRAQVALALSLAKHPEILLLDEPLASLDPLARREFLQLLMESVVEDSTTVVLSSHLIADLERVCDYLMILSQGKIQLAGSIEDILTVHSRITGSKKDPTSVAGVAEIIEESHTGRQTTALARLESRILDPSWVVEETSLEEVVLGYLGRGRTFHDHASEAARMEIAR
ncbi:MAG: ABC transporter ATP-binding protein [Actinomycetota bacterium]